MASENITSERELKRVASASPQTGADDADVLSPVPASTDQAATRETVTDGDDPFVGMVISDRYRLIERVGEGGMGAVYRGEHISLRKRVAVKFLHAELSRISDVVMRFEREAVAAANLEHANVVAAHDFGKTKDGQFYLVMEFVEGGTLRDLLDKEGRLAPLRGLHITRHIAAALQRAHALEIVHRDLKPDNVVMVEREDDKDFAKVIDFGIAKVTAGRLADGGKPLTQAGMVFGTPDYMAPEQALGGNVDLRADLYAFAVMVFEMLVGQRPFDGDDVMAVLGKHMTQPPPSASQLAPPGVLPIAIDAVFMRALAKSPADRYTSAAEFVQAIEQALGVASGVTGQYPAGLLAPVSIGTPPFGIAAPPPSVITGQTPAIGMAAATGLVPPSAITTGAHAPIAAPSAIPRGTLASIASITEPAREAAKQTMSGLASGYGELRKDPARHKRAVIGVGIAAAAVVIFAIATRPSHTPTAVAPTPTPRVPPSLVHAAPPALASEHAPPTIAPTPTPAPTPADAPSAANDSGAVPATLAAQLAEYQSRPNVRLLLDAARGRQLRPVIAAFEQTREQAPDDAIVNYILGGLYMRVRGRGASSIERYADAVRLAPGFAHDHTLVRDVVNAFAVSRRVPTQATTLLTGALSSDAGPVMVEAFMNAHNASTRARLLSVLSAPPFSAYADPTLRGLFELAAATSCEQKLPVVQQLGREGDGRALPYLRAIRTSPNGCGLFGVMACNPCLSEALPAAIASVQQRSP